MQPAQSATPFDRGPNVQLVQTGASLHGVFVMTNWLPFVTGGVQFTAFSQPNDYGNRETKYGVNYGAGVKVKVKEPWGFRLDARQYNMGKPFHLLNNNGRLLMWEFSGGISFFL